MDFAPRADVALRREVGSRDEGDVTPAWTSETGTHRARPVLPTFGCSSTKGFSLMTNDQRSKVSATLRAAKNYYPRFVEAYCTLDPRSLGVGRIGLGVLLL